MKKFHPKRKCTKEKDQEIWDYEDPNDQALAIKGAIFQFNLVDFDTWLMKLETCAAKDQLIGRRQAAVDAKNISVLQRHLEFMSLQWSSIDREDFLLSLAKIGDTSQKNKTKAAEASKKIRQESSDKLSKSIRELRNEMLIEFEEKDRTLLNIHLIRRYAELHKVKISNYLIRKAIANPEA